MSIDPAPIQIEARQTTGSRLASLPAPLVLWAVLAVAVAGTLVAVLSLGSEDLFRYSQSAALGIAAPVLEPNIVEKAIDRVPAPVPKSERTPAVHTVCAPRGSGPLRNPWTCSIVYRSGTTAHYLIEINDDGSFTGLGTGTIRGCCVTLPEYG
jgi:hypothetical protein